MRILSAKQHHALDEATMRQEDISNLDLMERAATAWSARFQRHYPDKRRRITVLVGPGNNGGDGLVAARLLRFEAYTVNVIWAAIGKSSPDNDANLRRAKDVGVPLRQLHEGDDFPVIPAGSLLIDALFGTGLSRPVTGYWAELIGHVNELDVERVALDLPSGMSADQPATGSVVRAHRTLSLGYPKLALFAPANSPFLGHWELVPFAQAHGYVATLPDDKIMLTEPDIARLLKVRGGSDHKGTFGHALLIAGAYEKMGAAVIAARAVLRSGAGLVTTHLPRIGYQIMQLAFPEAMCRVDEHQHYFTGAADLERYDVVGIGPGIGQEDATREGLFRTIAACRKPMVVDADALNLLARHPEHLSRLPERSILTPHPKEFERLFGQTENDFQRWELQRARAQELAITIILKTGHTAVATPDGRMHFNTTGNPGMGTAGTGDALTGVLTGLLAQGYTPEAAAKLGVYLHGLAGDLAAQAIGQESMIAEDLILQLGAAFRRLHAVRKR
ncbi:NAD(P)H-hydrate dehydratase [Lewinella sp. JB7]|uniref:NAD(P)H-hydrate dehydratase n=1 Tax=Lewinella sp. JB7 TaxID=2962887 RepID=UPI0020C9728C|nr:NAD(P)H-hydrate dehydratase [Lewinella sp. JB7]MCP9237586.1 NAD(P)H-hydrate dehydratase [Lewinella sp. JB7]